MAHAATKDTFGHGCAFWICVTSASRNLAKNIQVSSQAATELQGGSSATKSSAVRVALTAGTSNM